MKLAVRHIVSVGKRSFAVVIPKKWALELGLTPGSNVILKLNRDRSIVVYPVGGDRKPNMYYRAKCKDHSLNPSGDRLGLKILLSAYAFGLAARCFRGELLSIAGDDTYSLERGFERSVALAVNMVEKAAEHLGKIVRGTDDGHAEVIHDIERRMDLLFYKSIRDAASEMIAGLSKEIESGNVVSYVVGALLFKTMEDLVDSIDRLVWRIQETGVFSKELAEVVGGMEALIKDVLGCIRYPCDEDELREYYARLIASKKALKAGMMRSPQPIQPAMAEAESMINAVEDLIEAALIISTKNRLKKLRGSEGLASDM